MVLESGQSLIRWHQLPAGEHPHLAWVLSPCSKHMGVSHEDAVFMVVIFHSAVSHAVVHPGSWKSSTRGTFLLKGQATSLTVTLSIVLPSALIETVG